MDFSRNKIHQVATLGFLILSFSFFRFSTAYASYYEISGSGTWTTTPPTISALYTNNGSWNFSFDLPSSFTLSAGITSASTNLSGIIFTYSGSTTYDATNFQFNNQLSSQIEFVNTSGSFSGTLGPDGSGTYAYSGGITFGTSANSNQDGFLFETCLSGCQISPTLYGPDGFVITLANGGGPILSSSDTLAAATDSIDLSFNGGLGTGTGSLIIGLESGQIPGSPSSTPSATPEPSTLALFGTGILLLGYTAYRRKTATA